ncbi:MAG: hypothetical protein NT028_11640 [candidate division Zixibacteria bacterium]|nr:hypothetical protein [candidate division Zixibacteria bacterium]
MYKEGNGIIRLAAAVVCVNGDTSMQFTAAMGITTKKGVEKQLRKDGWEQDKHRRWVCHHCAASPPSKTGKS